jgi:hypothetical protein
MSYTEMDRTSMWLETLFQADPSMPGSKIARPDNLVVGPGVESTEEDNEDRAKLYTFDNIQNAYKMLHLCSITESPSKSESLVHAHAETFLKRAYAAWNLSGQTRRDYEESLKVYMNASLSDLFSLNAPICNPNTNEILALQDIHEEVNDLRKQLSALKVQISRRDDVIAELKDSIAASKEREEYFELHLQDSIKGATAEIQGKYEYLVKHSDVVVAAAIQDAKEKLNDMRSLYEDAQDAITKQEKKTLKQEAIARERLMLLSEAEEELKRMQMRLKALGESPVQSSKCSIM